MTSNQTPLSYEATKTGQRVILLQGSETDGQTAIRGAIVGRKDGWLSVRFDDGVTRMARAKTLALDTTPVIEFKPKEPATPTVAQMPIGGARSKPAKVAKPKDDGAKARAVAAQRAKVDAVTEPSTKPAKAAKSPKQPKPAKPAKVGQPCLCACGELANPGRAFRQGHDARFHGWMRRLADERLLPSEVPPAALKLMNVNRDGVPTTDYDGTPWKP